MVDSPPPVGTLGQRGFLGTRYFATALDIFVTAGASAKLAISLLRTLWETRKTADWYAGRAILSARERRGMDRDAMDRLATAYSKCRVRPAARKTATRFPRKGGANP